jgi:ribosomal protein S27E
MADVKCPGQDTRYWKKGDIFDVRCPKCGKEVEFFKDDVRRRCKCGRTIVNPKLDLACAEWCQHAEKCVDGLPAELKAKKAEGKRERK